MNSKRLERMKKKELVDLVFRLSGWIADDASLWDEEDIRYMFSMELFE